MKLTSLLFFEIATVLLITTGFSYRLPELAIASVFAGAFALLSFAISGPVFVHAALGLYAIITGLFGLFHMPPLLCAAALAAALIGWDAGLIAPMVSGASTLARRRFALGYTLRAFALACLGVLLVAAAGTIHVSLSFGTGLALSFAVLILAALFLRTLRRADGSESDASPDHE